MAAHREAARAGRPKRPRRPLTEKVRDGRAEVLRGVDKLLDVTRDDRYPRKREELEPEVRNSLIYVMREAGQALEDVSPYSKHYIADRSKIPSTPSEDQGGGMESLWEHLLYLADLTSALMVLNGKDRPVPRPDVTIERIDTAIAGLIEARAYVQAHQPLAQAKVNRSQVCEMPVPSVTQT